MAVGALVVAMFGFASPALADEAPADEPTEQPAEPAEDPADEPVADEVETGKVDGAVVAVAAPPVPVAEVPEVAVGAPPVPPIPAPDVAVGKPPVPTPPAAPSVAQSAPQRSETAGIEASLVADAASAAFDLISDLL